MRSREEILASCNARCGFCKDDYYSRGYLLPITYRNDFMATEDDRWAVLETMGICKDDGDTPLQAWRNVCQELSGETAGTSDFDMCFSPTAARQFAFYLA